LELFKLLGYDLEIKKLVDKKIVKNEIQYISKSTVEKKIIPNFLIDRNDSKVDIINLQKGLKLVGDYLEKTILKPNNLNQPISRLQFINTIK
jgi:DNA repair protein RecO (recombination protein O)